MIGQSNYNTKFEDNFSLTGESNYNHVVGNLGLGRPFGKYSRAIHFLYMKKYTIVHIGTICV
jgi:hypothetical protein